MTQNPNPQPVGDDAALVNRVLADESRAASSSLIMLEAKARYFESRVIELAVRCRTLEEEISRLQTAEPPAVDADASDPAPMTPPGSLPR